MEFTEDQLKLLQQLGALGASADECINVLDIENADVFKTEIKTPGTPAFEAYKIGRDKGHFAIDSKLFNEAKTGEVAAAVELRIRNEKKQIAQLKSDLFGV